MLALAESLKLRNLPFRFLINAHAPSQEKLEALKIPYDLVDLEDVASGWENGMIERHRFKVWINDRLDTPASHAHRIKEAGLPLVTFDDRGEGAVLADLHVACLAGFQEKELLGRKVLTGLDYLILNPEIAQHRRERTEPGPILVTLGGTDTYGATIKVIEILGQLNKMATVVIGPGFEHRQALKRVLAPGIEVKQNVPSLIREFGRCNLAVTGGGMTVFEALACGVPCIVVANEPHEVPIGRRLEAWGVARFAGFYEELDPACFSGALDIPAMSQRALQLVSTGGADRILDELIRL